MNLESTDLIDGILNKYMIYFDVDGKAYQECSRYDPRAQFVFTPVLYAKELNFTIEDIDEEDLVMIDQYLFYLPRVTRCPDCNSELVHGTKVKFVSGIQVNSHKICPTCCDF